MPYWDGGLFDNTPLSKVIGALQESPDPEKTMYVVNLFPSSAPLPRTMPEVITRMMTLAFSNQTEKDLQRAHQTTEIIKLVQELDRLMPAHPELQALAAASRLPGGEGARGADSDHRDHEHRRHRPGRLLARRDRGTPPSRLRRRRRRRGVTAA